MTSNSIIKIGDNELDEIIILINDYSGYDFSDYSKQSLQRRVQRYIDVIRVCFACATMIRNFSIVMSKEVSHKCIEPTDHYIEHE